MSAKREPIIQDLQVVTLPAIAEVKIRSPYRITADHARKRAKEAWRGRHQRDLDRMWKELHEAVDLSARRTVLLPRFDESRDQFVLEALEGGFIVNSGVNALHISWD